MPIEDVAGAVGDLIREGKVTTVHDVSDGGLIVAIAAMNIMGRNTVGGIKFVAVGDSNGNGCALGTASISPWPMILKAAGGGWTGRHRRCCHSGIKTGTIGQASTLNDATNIACITAERPDGTTFTKTILLYYAGVNDLLAGTTGANLLTYVQSWVTGRVAEGSKVVILNIPNNAFTSPAWTGAMETERLAYNAGLSGLTGVSAIVDISTALGDVNGAGSANRLADKLHYSQAGHAAVAAAVQAAVNPLTL